MDGEARESIQESVSLRAINLGNFCDKCRKRDVGRWIIKRGTDKWTMSKIDAEWKR
jgi:hypothetical protein